MALAAARDEITRVITRDAGFSGGRAVLPARMRSVIAAHRALERQEDGAYLGLRQALIELAAASEAAVDELPEQQEPEDPEAPGPRSG